MAELGCCQGSWLLALPMTQAAFVSMKGAQRHNLAPGRQSPGTPASQAQTCSGEKSGVAGFGVRRRQDRVLQCLGTAVLLGNFGQLTQPL